MTADRHLPNEELQRAILADGIARLEKQMEAAESRARDAEAEAREAKAALAEVLLEKAHGQKSKREVGQGRAVSPAEREIRSLRAEIEAAQRDLRQQEKKLQEAREDAAEDLRAEYEEKFHAARERLAQELQRRLTNAESASGEPLSGTAGDVADGAGAARPSAWDTIGRMAFVVPVVAFAGGLLLGWAAPSSETEPDIAATPAPPPVVVEAAPAASARPEVAEPAAPPPAEPAAAESPPPDTTVSAALAPASEGGDMAAVPEPLFPEPAPEPNPLQERNASLVLQIEEIRRLLDEASERADTAEAALDAERRKSAALARRAATAERRNEDSPPPGNAAPTPPPPNPESIVERIPPVPPVPAYVPGVE